MADSTSEKYTHGHHDSVVAAHAVRRASEAAAFVLPQLKSPMRLLDYGCGPVSGKRVGQTKMNQITYGLQLGGQVYSQMIFFRDKRAFEDFTSGNFEFGAQATAVALTAGAQASTSTGGGGNTSAGTDADSSTVNANERQYDGRSGMAVFTIAKGGLMYEATLGGQKFKYEPI